MSFNRSRSFLEINKVRSKEATTNDVARGAIRRGLHTGGRAHYAADGVFGDFGEVFGENATIGKFFDTVGTAQADDPAVFGFFGIDRSRLHRRE